MLTRFYTYLIRPETAFSPSVFNEEERVSFHLGGDYAAQVKRVFLAFLPLLEASSPGSYFLSFSSLTSRSLNAYNAKKENFLDYVNKAAALGSLICFFYAPQKQLMVNGFQDVLLGVRSLYREGLSFSPSSPRLFSLVSRVAVSVIYTAAFTVCTASSLRVVLLAIQFFGALCLSYKEFSEGWYLEALTQFLLSAYLGTKMHPKLEEVYQEKVVKKAERHLHNTANYCFSLAHFLAQPAHKAFDRGYHTIKETQGLSEKALKGAQSLAQALFSLPFAFFSVVVSSFGRICLAFSGRPYLHTVLEGRKGEDSKGIFNLNVGALPDGENRLSVDHAIVSGFDSADPIPNEVGKGLRREQFEQMIDYLVGQFREGYDLALEEVVDREFIELLVEKLKREDLFAHMYTNMDEDPFFVGISSGLAFVSHQQLHICGVKALSPSQPFLDRIVACFTTKEKPEVVNVHTHLGGKGQKERLSQLRFLVEKVEEVLKNLKQVCKGIFFFGDFNHETSEELENMKKVFEEGNFLNKGEISLLTLNEKNSLMLKLGEVPGEFFSKTQAENCSWTDHGPLVLRYNRRRDCQE